MDNTYTWLQPWNSDLLSPWGYFERFKYANALSEKQFVGLIQKKWVQPHLKNAERKVLAEMPGLDDKKIQQIFGLSLMEQSIQFRNRFWKKYARHDKWPDTTYPTKRLRFCPVCIGHGFHSQLHQIRGINLCAFHNVELQADCPKCGRGHWYALRNTGFESPFICECGFSFMNGLNDGMWHADEWSLHHDWTIINKEVLALESKSFDFVLEHYFDIVDEESLNAVYRVYKSYIRHLRAELTKAKEYGQLKIIQQFIGTNDLEFSPRMYAYIKIQMYSEALVSYTSIDAGVRDIRRNLLNGLLADSSRIFKTYRDMRGIRRGYSPWVIQRTIVSLTASILIQKTIEYLSHGFTLQSMSRDVRMKWLRAREQERNTWKWYNIQF